MKRKGLAAVRAGLERPSGRLLIAVNAGVLVGALLFGWSIFEIIFLFWAENVIIGIINVLKMLTARPGSEPPAGDQGQASPAPMTVAGWIGTLFFAAFFTVHYGGFCYGHGVFVLSIFNEQGEFGDDLLAAVPALLSGGLALSLALLATSHLFSFVTNYLGSGEFRRTSAQALMVRPYGRIVALHVTILLGGFLAMALGDPVWMLVVLVLLKTLVDLALHGSERRKYLPQAPA